MLVTLRARAFALALGFLLLPAPGSAQEIPDKPPPQVPGQLDATTTEALERLAVLLAQKRAERKVAAAASDAVRTAALDAELRDLGWQFGGLASRLDVQEFEAPQVRQFDLQQEVEQLIRPLVQTLKDATAKPRQIADLQGRIETLQQRQRVAESARASAERTRDLLPPGSPARGEVQAELDVRWRPAIDGLRREIVVLQARLLSLQQGQQSLLESVTATLQNFVQSSGLNLLLAAAVFFGVLSLLRWLQARLLRRGAGRGFSLRLFEVVWSAASLVLAVAAALVVPYVRNDWLLLAVGIVFLIGVGWVLVRMLPQFFEQFRLVLNIGAVREGERIDVDGLPYRVEQLRFYTRLVNPDLDGGVLRMPIRDLIGRRSRRSGEGEPWFPCRPGDVVRLADGTFGTVRQQTPGVVVVDSFGTPRSYPTAAFLQQVPRNLSRGFRVEATFGVGHRHREGVAPVEARLRAALAEGLGALVPAAQLRRVDVQFQAASASSLDYLVFADFDGAAAGQEPELRRALQRLCVDACVRHGLEIPLPQFVVRRAGS